MLLRLNKISTQFLGIVLKLNLYKNQNNFKDINSHRVTHYQGALSSDRWVQLIWFLFPDTDQRFQKDLIIVDLLIIYVHHIIA